MGIEGKRLEWAEDGTWCVRVGPQGAPIWRAELRRAGRSSAPVFEAVSWDRWNRRERVAWSIAAPLEGAVKEFRRWAEEADAEAVAKVIRQWGSRRRA